MRTVLELLKEEKKRYEVSSNHKSLAYILLSQIDDLNQLTDAERWVVRTAWTKEQRESFPWITSFDLRSEYCPINILEVTAKEGDEFYRREVVLNPKTPTEILKLFVSDKRLFRCKS
jgi:hypothetical protein